MFIGEYIYTIDQKKRLAIPVKFRQHIGKKAVLTKGLDQCLFLFSLKEWETLAGRLSNLPLSQKDVRGFARLMLAGAMQVDIDPMGRILIPDYLKQYALIQKSVVVAGLYTRIEIWAKEQWDEYKVQAEKEIGDMAERLKELGI